MGVISRETRWRWFQAVLITGLLAGFAWWVLRPHEPFYQGKPLSFWLDEAYQSRAFAFDCSEPTAKAALRALGTNALPILVNMAGTRGSIPKLAMGGFGWDRDLAFLHLPPQYGKPELAAWGFKLFGAEAKPAVPSLVRLLRHRMNWVQMDAAACLGAIGPSAEEAVPELLATFARHSGTRYNDVEVREAVVLALGEIGPAARAAIPVLAGITNSALAELVLLKLKGESVLPVLERLKDTSNANNWCEVAYTVGGLGTNAAPAIPYLLSALNHTNSTIRQEAIRALGHIHQQPELCVPQLTAELTETNEHLWGALEALRHFGPAAKPAVPRILPLFRDPTPWSRSEVTNALRDIAPESLAELKTNTPVYDFPAAR